MGTQTQLNIALSFDSTWLGGITILELKFDKHSLVTNIIREFKCLRRKEAVESAKPTGQKGGEELLESSFIPDKIDMIIPAQRRPKRLKSKRIQSI